MPTQPFFSIIIPTLNEENFLPTLLQDLTTQSLTNFEVIVVDAKSTDQTLSRAKTFSSRLRLTLITSNIKNVSNQRNLGGKKAKGNWIIFFDADNQLLPDFLQKIRSNLIDKPTDIFSTFMQPDSTNPKDQIVSLAWNLGSLTAATLNQPTAFGACIGIKTQIFKDSSGFNPKITYQEDREFIARLVANGYKFTIFPIPRIIYSFRRFRKEGRLNLIRKSALLNLQNSLEGFTSHNNSKDYPMLGGSYYANDSTVTTDFQQLNQLIKKLTQTQLKKLVTFLHDLSSPND